MALSKAVGYFVVLLVIFYSLGKTGYGQSLNVFFEDLIGRKVSHIHAREKRAAQAQTTPASSVTFSCGGTQCPSGQDCLLVDGTSRCMDPCDHYTPLDDAWRATDSRALPHRYHCDKPTVWQGWYRLFLGNSSVQIPERCIEKLMCGTGAPLWLQTPHPQLSAGIIQAQVCGSGYSGCCHYQQHPIHVKACAGNYSVYKFIKPTRCHMAYCADVNTKIPVCNTCTAAQTCVSNGTVWRCEETSTRDLTTSPTDPSTRDLTTSPTAQAQTTPASSVTFSCGGTQCPSGQDCLLVDGTSRCMDPCDHYTPLDDAWRATDIRVPPHRYHCDVPTVWQGWYRLFLGNSSVQIPERCIEKMMCGTGAPLWLQTPHPQLSAGIIQAQVCGSGYSGCCHYPQHPIHVKACAGNYYVYKFIKPYSCDLAYCADVNSKIHVCNTCTAAQTCVSNGIVWRCEETSTRDLTTSPTDPSTRDLTTSPTAPNIFQEKPVTEDNNKKARGQEKDYQITTVMTISRGDVLCDDEQYGTGKKGNISSIGCDEGQSGNRTARCQDTGDWKLIEDTCIITRIKELLIVSQDLVEDGVETFAKDLAKTLQKDKEEIANSSATISAIVDILTSIANISTNVSQSVMENVLRTVDAIIGDDSRQSWAFLNANKTRNVSSDLLGSLETLSEGLIGEFSFSTTRILLNRTTFYNSFKADLNSSIVIDISNTNSSYLITTILSSFNNVMPSRNASVFNATSDFAINAAVVLVQINDTIQNVTLSYRKLNNSLSHPQCVFWNFTLFDELGAWDEEGCTFVPDMNDTVTCICDHLTSFSILMATDIPPELREALDIITYVGVGISMACLVICLIIEGYVWKAITRNSTAYMRQVSIINTALSLLIADICFIVGASFARNPLENPGPCSTVTFFMHFFYLAMFFWMLVSGLLVFYRIVMVFSNMSKSAMLAIGFCLGYGCPLIIAVITVAVTAGGNGYIRKDDACWLNWTETKALLAMVIPALSIVMINILITIVVLFKILRRGVGASAQADEKHTLLVILRCIAILTPLFGLTWSLGVGTMIPSTNKGIHIAFAFFNSLQGFFILMFGTLIDSKVRSILARRLSTSSTGSYPVISTSGGLNLINRLLGRRHVYHLSGAANSSSNGTSESFSNI